MLHPVNGVVHLVSGNQLAGFAVKGVDNAVTVGVGKQLTHVAVFVFLLTEHHDVHARVIPFVVRCFLVGKLRLASINVTTPNGHCPFVITRTHGFIPWCWVTGTEVNHVGGRVVSVPAPVGSTPNFPRTGFPRRNAQTTLTVLWGLIVKVISKQDVFIWPGRVSTPNLFTGVYVVSRDIASDAQFSTGGAD